MAESYLSLSKADQAEVLELGRERTGRPAHLLEKDIWVVWTLGTLPTGAARDILAADYASMLEDQVMAGNTLPFEDLMQACAEVAARANATASS